MNRDRKRLEGSALVLVFFLGMGLMTLTLISVEISRSQSVAQRGHKESFNAKQIARSAAGQALARIKYGGFLEPHSGTGTSPSWVDFSDGQYYYYTVYDADNTASTIRAWGRVPAEDAKKRSSSTLAPDDVNWDRTGWIVRGVEIAILSTKYIPTSPGYFGNGGIEKPRGGFAWGASVDPADPSTWIKVTSPDSYQSSSVPMEVSALNHPYDYLYNGGFPAPALLHPHPYQVWVSQNPIGQFNTEAWFANSAGKGDATTGVTPDPDSDYDPDAVSYSHAYPIHSDVADVSQFGFEMWSQYKDAADTIKLDSGNRQGTFGDLDNPAVVFVTGNLNVRKGKTFRGAGVLVIRDDYDPNVDTNNTPTKKASMSISGTLEWTGLVIVTGWAPKIEINSGGSATILGSLLGEDSVQSGGEISLDSATINLYVKDKFRLLYSSGLFEPGGIIHDYLPAVVKTVVGVRELDHSVMNMGGLSKDGLSTDVQLVK